LLPATSSARRPSRGRHRAGRHAAPRTSRSLLLPGLLLAGAGAGLLGMAGLPSASRASEAPSAALPAAQQLRVTAAVAPLAAAGTPATAAAARGASAARVERDDAASSQARASRSRRAVQPERVAPTHVQPVPGPVSSTFGPRWGRLHAGIDFAVPVGTRVRAIAAGVVVSRSYDAGGYGYHVVVRHPDGTSSLYAHLSTVRELGHRVVVGQVVGRSGNTGHSTGPHLHFEMRRNAHPFDPQPWLARRGIEVQPEPRG